MEEFKAAGIPKSSIHMHGNHACMTIPHGHFHSHLHTRFSLYTTYPFYTHYPPSTQHSFPSCMAILISHLSPFLFLHHVFVFQMLIKLMPRAFVWPCMATLTLTNVSTISFHPSNSIVPVTMLTSPYPSYPFHTHAHPNHAVLTIPVSSMPSFPLHHHTRHPLSISYP